LRRFVTGQQFHLSFQLEADAPRNAGQVVEFEPFAFDAPEPEAGSDGNTYLDVSLGAVGIDAKEYVDAVMDSWPPVLEVIWREYLSGIATPTAVIRFEGEAWTIKELSVGFRCGQVNFAARDIAVLYEADVFKGLAGLI